MDTRYHVYRYLLRHPTLDAVKDHLRGRLRILARPWPVAATAPVRCFFIIGSGRNGSTLLRRMLMSAPEIHIPPENHVLGTMTACYRSYGFLPWRDLVNLSLGIFATHQEFVHFQLQLFPVKEKLLRLPPERRSLGDLIDVLYRQHAVSVGRPEPQIWGDKSPTSTIHVHRLARAFPQAKFIHLIRHGIDVAYSFDRAGLLDLYDAATTWADRTRAAREFCARHPERSLTVRYEDLVREPEAVIATIAEFLWDLHPTRFDTGATDHVKEMGDVPALAHLARVREAITAASIGKARRELPANDLNRLHELLGPELVALGYES